MVMLQNQPRRTVSVSDVTGGRRVSLDLPDSEDTTVGELIDSLLPKMQSPTVDSAGRTLTYTLRSELDGGARLHRSQPLSDIRDKDALVLAPNIDAG